MSSQISTKAAGAARTGKRYDETFKLDAVRLRQQAGRPRAQVARDLGVSEVSLAAGP
jgi:transposase-like protein